MLELMLNALKNSPEVMQLALRDDRLQNCLISQR